MLYLKMRNTVVTFLIFTFSVVTFSQDREKAQKLFWNMDISNTNQCAQQSQAATPSIYMFIDGYIPGRGSLNAAIQTKENLSIAVKSSWGQFHQATTGLTMKILNGLSTKELKTLSQAEINQWSQSCLNQNCGLDIDKYWNSFEARSAKTSKAFCHEIIQPIPSMFSTTMQKKDELEKIALSYLEAEKYLRTCDQIPAQKEGPDALYKFSTGLDSEQISFEYWESFKIYSSWAWRQSNYLDKVVPEYSQVFKSLTIEDAIVMIPEGCYSVKKPECGTDDLSEAHLRTMGDNKLFRLTAKGTANDLRESSLVHPTEWSTKDTEIDPETGKSHTVLVDPRHSRITNTDNYRSFLLNMMDSRIRTSSIADNSLAFLQTLFNQRTPEALIFDFNRTRFRINENSDDNLEMELMCAEVLAMREKNLSFFAKEMSSTQGIFSNLKRLNFPGQFPQELVNKAFATLDQILPICSELTKANAINPKKYADANKLKMGLWYQRLSASTLDTSLVGIPTPPAGDSRAKKYLYSAGEGLCVSEVQCLRQMMESVADLYSISMYANSIFGTGPARNNRVSENFGVAVACGKYDPWYEAQHRRKKLLLDVASSLVQAVLPIPFYIELDPRRPEVMSFKERIETGQIKFAPEMTPTNYDITTYLDFGPLTHTPCALSLGLGGKEQANSSQVYAFTGVTGTMCSKERKSQQISASAENSGLSEKNVEGKSICGSCTYQFAPIKNSAAYFENIRYWGAGIRLFQGVLKFFASKKDVDMPQSFEINPEAVAETYKKYNGIPAECVWELHHGVRCMKNLCVSSTVSRIEKMTGQKVKDASLYSNPVTEGRSSTEKQIWMKLESCDGEIGVTVTCDDNDSVASFSKNKVQTYGSCRGVLK